MAVQRQFWELLVWRSNQVLRSDLKLFVNAQVLDPDLLVPDPDPQNMRIHGSETKVQIIHQSMLKK